MLDVGHREIISDIAKKMDLPHEIIRAILEYAFGDEPSSIRKARLVCQSWAALLKPIIFRTLKLTFSVPREQLNKAIFYRFSSDPGLARLVRRVEVLNWYDSGLLPPHHPELDTWIENGNSVETDASTISTTIQARRLQALLPALSLQEFYWRARPRIPGWFLTTIRQELPNCSLEIVLRIDHVLKPNLLWTEPLIPALESLHSLRLLRAMKALRSLNVVLAADKPFLFHELQDVVQTAPQLERLTVYAAALATLERREWHAVTSWPWKTTPVPGTILFPQIRKLKMHNFCICHDKDPSWLEFLHWKLLDEVGFTCPNLLILLEGQFQSLQSLHLQVQHPLKTSSCLRQSLCERLRISLLQCQKLKVLEIENISAVVDHQLLSCVGAQLRKLHLHEDEHCSPYSRRRAITPSQVRTINENCPLLVELSIDIEMEQNWNWPLDLFELIAVKLGYIKHLSLNFELGRLFTRRSTHPRPVGKFAQVTEKTARQIFSYIRDSYRSSELGEIPPNHLERMTISRGFLDQADNPRFTRFTRMRRTPWVRFQSLSFTMQYSRKESELFVSCPELEILRSSASELVVQPEHLDHCMISMSTGLVSGPHLDPDSVLEIPQKHGC